MNASTSHRTPRRCITPVIGRPITSVYPVHNEHVEAWNRIVVGRQVHQQTAEMKLMWSTGRLVDGACTISLNHFVVLHPVPNAQQTQPLPDTSLSNSAPASQQSSNTAKPKRRRQHPASKRCKKQRVDATATEGVNTAEPMSVDTLQTAQNIT